MSLENSNTADHFLAGLFAPPDAALDGALRSSAAAGLPPINVSPMQGHLLQWLARLCAARRILEIGTLGGFSTIWLARALPAGGTLVTLELDPDHAAVARGNLAGADLADRVELRLGPAAESLAQLVAEGRGPFDLIFIDADKPGLTDYFQWSLKLAHPGTLIVADNVIRKGAVADAATDDPAARGARRFLTALAAEPRVRATVIQTVGSKGHDGMALAVVTEAPHTEGVPAG